MKISINRDLCSGVGNCVVIAPQVFKLDKTNKAIIMDAGSADEKMLMEAAESCPENAIIVKDDNGNQIYP